MITLNNVAVGDQYSDGATLGPVVNAQQIAFSLANNSAVIQIANSGVPIPDWGPEILLVPTQGATLSRCMGVRFRNAVPGSVARVVAILSQPSDPILGAGTAFTGTLAAGGGVSPGAGAVVTGRVSAAGAILSGTGFTVNKTGTGTYVITLTTALANPPTVMATSDTPSAGVGSQAGLVSATLLTVNGFTINTWAQGSTVGVSDRQFAFTVFTTV